MAEEDTEITLRNGQTAGTLLHAGRDMRHFLCCRLLAGQDCRAGAGTEEPAGPELAGRSRGGELKPSGAAAPAANASPAADNGETAKESAPDLTFYKAVKQNPGEETKPAPELKSSPLPANVTAANAVAIKPHEMPAASTAAAKPMMAAKADASPIPAASAPQANPSATYLVQIAAVTHEEDAAALAGALRKKSYAAAVVNSPMGKDKFFHVGCWGPTPRSRMLRR